MADITDPGITFPDSITINNNSKNPISVNVENQLDIKQIDVKIVDTSNIIRELAMMLYSYADFSKIQSNKDFARLCIQRAKDFAEVFNNIK